MTTPIRDAEIWVQSLELAIEDLNRLTMNDVFTSGELSKIYDVRRGIEQRLSEKRDLFGKLKAEEEARDREWLAA